MMETSSALLNSNLIFPQPVKAVFSSHHIATIKAVFQSRKLSAAQDHEFPELCFRKILKACKRKEWTKIQALGNAILGLEHNGRNLYQAFIEEGDEIEVTEFIKNREQLIVVMSNGHHWYGLHYAAARNGGERMFKALEKRATLYDFPNSKKKKVKKLIYNLPNPQEKSPIHCAIESKSIDSLKILINKKASLFATFFDPKTSLHFSPVTYAVYLGSTACFDLLMEQNNIDLKNEHTSQGSVLHVALLNDQTEMFEHLLTKHLDTTQCFISQKNVQRKTLLMIAAARGNIEAIATLRTFNVNFNDTDDKGRTALHYAVIENQVVAIKFLIGCGADVNCIDIYGRLPSQYVRVSNDSDSIKDCLNKAANLQKKSKYYPPNYFTTPPDTLIFKGGGPKGIKYIGVIKGLEQKNLLDGAKRFAGTSAGAITALLLSLKFSFDDLSRLLTSTPLTDFMDYEGSDTPLEQLLPNSKENISLLSKFLRQPLEYIKLLNHLHSNIGICEGTAFLEWLSDTIFDKTKIKYFTFGDLRREIEKNEKGYRHLHVFGTKIGPNSGIVHLNSEDREWDDYIIADAVRVSMSIPFLFKPHKLYKRVKGKNGEDERIEAGPAHYIDGGLINNMPIEAFDRRRYIKPDSSEEEKDFPQANKRVLAFNLYSSDEIQQEDAPITTFSQFVSSVMGIFRHAETHIHKQRSYDVHRIVNLDNLGIKLWDFKMDPEVQKKMIDSGEVELAAFLENNQKYYENLMETSQSNRVSDISSSTNSKKSPSTKEEEEKEEIHEALNDHTTEIISTEDLKLPPPFTKEEEDKIFSRGPKAVALTAPMVGGIGLVTLALEVPGIILKPFKNIRIWKPANRSLFRRRLTMLAMDDERFKLFDLLPANLVEAEKEFYKNEEFFKKCCQSELFLDYLIASNKKINISFFKEKKLLKMEPRDVTYRHSYHSKEHMLDINWSDSTTTFLHILEDHVFSNLFFKAFKEDSTEAFSALLDFPEAKLPIDLKGNTILHYLASLMVIENYYPLKNLAKSLPLPDTDLINLTSSYQKELDNLLSPFVEILFKHDTFKFYLNAKNSRGETPLLISIKKKNWHLTILLMKSKGIDLAETSDDGKTILRLLMEHKKRDLVDLFFKNIKPAQLKKILQKENEYIKANECSGNLIIEPILIEMHEFNIDHLEVLIANGIDLRQQSPNNCKTIFYLLARNNQEALLRLACKKLKKDHPENYLEMLNKVVKSNDHGAIKTALMIAAEKNNYEVVKFLIEEGADYTIEIDGRTALSMAPTSFLRNESYKILEEIHYQNIRKNY